MRNIFARTLDEAFGPDARTACAITCYRRKNYGWLLWGVIVVGLAVIAILR